MVPQSYNSGSASLLAVLATFYDSVRICDVSWPKIHLGIELRLVLYSACIGLVKNEQYFY